MYRHYFDTANTMKCTVCKKETDVGKIFDINGGDAGIGLGYLHSLCFACYNKVPMHIPRQQILKWLNMK